MPTRLKSRLRLGFLLATSLLISCGSDSETKDGNVPNIDTNRPDSGGSDRPDVGGTDGTDTGSSVRPDSGSGPFTSRFCADIVGPTAVYWDYAHGFPNGITELPTIANPGEQFIHSQYPPLGFVMPQGYTATEINGNGAIGVNVLRTDNAVIWRYVPSVLFLNDITITDVLTVEINQLLNFYNFTDQLEVVCFENQSGVTNGFQVDFASRLIRFSDKTALVWVRLLRSLDQGLNSLSISISSGPTNEFDALVLDTFLPISWQLLVIDREVSDRDGDGVPDVNDRDPDDPNIQ